MTLPLLGMDVGFFNSLGAYPLDVRCEMLAELGYSATNLTLWSEPAWADLDRLSATATAHGLAAASVYATVDVSAPNDAPENLRVLEMISRLEGIATVELAILQTNASIPSSSQTGDSAATRFIEAALDRAVANEVTVALYPHTFAWMERIDDAVRLTAQFQTPQLGVVFPAFHWYCIDGTDLASSLALAAPHLKLVNTNGSRRATGTYFPATIEPIGDGEFDNFAFLGQLRRIGYSGFLGVQSYGVGGDAFAHFRRSRDGVRGIESRLDAHPRWPELRPDHI
jgi:sugar phosphate isomerase/epimerase